MKNQLPDNAFSLLSTERQVNEEATRPLKHIGKLKLFTLRLYDHDKELLTKYFMDRFGMNFSAGIRMLMKDAIYKESLRSE